MVWAEQQAVIFKILSALLWLGNVEYGPDNGDDEASAPSNPDALSQAAQLLGVNPSEMHPPQSAHSQNKLPRPGEERREVTPHVDGIPKGKIGTFPPDLRAP